MGTKCRSLVSDSGKQHSDSSLDIVPARETQKCSVSAVQKLSIKTPMALTPPSLPARQAHWETQHLFLQGEAESLCGMAQKAISRHVL